MKENYSSELQELRHSLGQYLSLKQVERSLYLVQSIIESQSVNLWSCAESLSRCGEMPFKKEQLYGQFLDHFQTGKWDKLLKGYFLAVFCLTLPFSCNELIMDRTEWQLGNRWHNLLVIGYICHDTLVPLVWFDLGERKSSNESERLDLIDRLRAWWKATGAPMPPLMLYADREFIGSQWFKALINRNIQFVIRLKDNQCFQVWQEGKLSIKAYNVKVIARYMKRKGLTCLELVAADEIVFPFTIAEQTLENGEKRTWLLAAEVQNPQSAAKRYARRWKIEDTFGYLKSKGLNLEAYNLVGHHKLEIMFALIVIVLAIAIFKALNDELIKQIAIKTYKNGKKYPAKSTFKLGFEAIRDIVKNVNQLLRLCLSIILVTKKAWKEKIHILNNSIVQ